MSIDINWWGVALAAVSAFAVGGLWYSVLLARPWQRAAGVSDEALRGGVVRAFVGTFVLSLVTAVTLAAFIGSNGVAFGALAGAAAGVAWVAAAFGVNALFERRSLTWFLINGGYNAIVFTAMGAIVGAFQAA
ncbi:DUF1761 domain-containing protein [Agromyces intestinalis]|uniref:DUF1761 domain-containing protein n=1 Tax=Agromyces intestinalis TaxID=2592652 RepID=A0A5C1YJB3_9MICO|nr:DUF1761 domain-containing protein [Agromyces intestinalis]QEO15625.1 DUF1761 domain-containing protein [Agromyces intestinalis]